MIYLHIPFCNQKCSYCGFYSSATKDSKQPYVDALCKEIEQRKSFFPDNHQIKTIYFGGGTPSILSPKQLSQIIQTLQENFNLSALEEATLEANPENLTEEYLQELCSLQFFNRLSIGVQSFNDNDLKRLNRRHSASMAETAILRSWESGIKNISIDLIYGLPSRTLDDWRANLLKVKELSPFISHLSCYSLTIEPQTILEKQIQKGIITPPEEDSLLEQYQEIKILLGDIFQQYEISNYCKPGMKSKHNSRYWDLSHYLGLGAAAHSFNGSQRRWNIDNYQAYIQYISTSQNYYEFEELSSANLLNEYIMTAIRTSEGLKKKVLEENFPQFKTDLYRSLAKYVSKGLMKETPFQFIATPKGLLLADGIASELFR